MAKPGKHKGSVRIISGSWRGRRIPVADAPGLRPTGDRVRETLFNWLQAYVPGSSCLDVFAGTGVLGLEAASRGATNVVLLEKHAAAVAALRDFVAGLGNEAVSVCQTNSLAYLAGPADQVFDLVFVDPPFDLDVQEQVLDLLAGGGWLSADAFVYVESSNKNAAVSAPSGWQLIRSKVIGEVRLQLFRTAS
jgi:16S rRNA (guanine966-N2)-methyltransferase